MSRKNKSNNPYVTRISDGLFIGRNAFKGEYDYFSEGYESGHSEGVVSRMADLLADVATGNVGGRNGDHEKGYEDKSSDNW